MGAIDAEKRKVTRAPTEERGLASRSSGPHGRLRAGQAPAESRLQPGLAAPHCGMPVCTGEQIWKGWEECPHEWGHGSLKGRSTVGVPASSYAIRSCKTLPETSVRRKSLPL